MAQCERQATGGETETTTGLSLTPGERKAWTVLVYMAGDNNLEGAGVSDLKEMEKVGSSDQVNVVVQFDRSAGALRYYVVKDGRGKRPVSPVLADLGQTNTGQPATLRDFLVWGIQAYPAKHYLTVIWNHGGGWKDDNPYRSAGGQARLRRSLFNHSVPLPKTAGKGVTRGWSKYRLIAMDDGARDFLDNQELQFALEKALATVGLPQFDIIGFDACLMSMLEVAYQVKNQAQVLVGSQEEEPNEGWDYAAVLHEVQANPRISPEELGQRIVTGYGAYFARKTPKETITQSALHSARIAAVAQALDTLAAALLAGYSRYSDKLLVIRNNVSSFQDQDYVDLWDMADLCEQGLNEPAISTAAQQVKQAVAEAVIKEVHQKKRQASPLPFFPHGISIYWPRAMKKETPDTLALYKKLDIVKDYPNWNNFIKKYLTPARIYR